MELTSTEIADRVFGHFDGVAPTINGRVHLHPVVLAVLEILKAEGMIDLEEP